MSRVCGRGTGSGRRRRAGGLRGGPAAGGQIFIICGGPPHHILKTSWYIYIYIYIHIYIYVHVLKDWPYDVCCPWVCGGWDLDALGNSSAVVAVPKTQA